MNNAWKNTIYLTHHSDIRYDESPVQFQQGNRIGADYIGNMIYEDETLKRILIDGGYIEGGVYYYYLTDHQGNNRMVVRSDGTVIQKNNYYPFGMVFAEQAVTVDEQDLQPYKYNGKELDRMHGLNQYDYSARYYDPALCRFTTVDPMAEKYYGVSPYVYCGDNPVNAVDITGMDWYWDQDKTRQYNPDITSQDQLQKGQTYIGTTDAVKDKNGNVIEDYRNDGSIMYTNETSGYRRMWNNTQTTGNEEMGIITDKGVLVLPSWNNGKHDSKVEKYNYAFDKGKLIDPVSDKEIPFSGTIHTHPTLETANGKIMNSWMNPSPEDYEYFGNRTPNIPFYVITANGKIHSYIPRSENLATPLILGNAGQTIGGIVFRNYSLKNRGK